MEILLELSKKILKRGGFAVKSVKNEVNFVSSVLRPFVLLDMGYELLHEIDKKYITHEVKRWFKEEDKEWMAAFRVFHRGMTNDELAVLSDYEDKLSEDLSADRQGLIESAEGCLQDFPAEYRRPLALMFTAEAVIVACTEFIEDGMHLGEADQPRLAINKGHLGINLAKDLGIKKNDYHEMCEHLMNAVKHAERTQYELRKAACGCKEPNDIVFGNDEKFMQAFNKMLEDFLDVTI